MGAEGTGGLITLGNMGGDDHKQRSNIMADNRLISMNTMFYLSTGEYSDYSIGGIFYALKDLNTDALKKEFIRTRKEEEEYSSNTYYWFDSHAFGAWLVKENYAISVDVTEWWLGVGD